MHIALFGGSFDPIHLGHQLVVAQVLEHQLFDEVWYVPIGNHDFGKKMSSATDRVAMLELILQPRTRIETFEIDSAEVVSYTHVTLEQLQAKYPDHRFSWLIGSDQLASLYKWGCDREVACFPALLDHFSFYVYPRTGYPMELPYPQLIPLTQVKEVAISSTEIRRRCRAGEAITDLVDPQVEAYIKTQKLYQEAR